MIFPKEFAGRMQSLLGDEYPDFVRSFEAAESSRGIRINTEKCKDPAALAAELCVHEKVEWCGSGFYAPDGLSGSHPYHAAGLIYFQEPSAMCAAEALPVEGDMRILDLCAAPGGKTTQLAARMNGRGLLIANEIIAKRAAILSENVERMGLKNTIVTNESPSRLADRFEGFFDGIVVDAPCSGEGMFRKEPQAAEAWSVEHTLSCAARQKNILDDAYRMLRPGGYMVYSTCTFSYDENEEVVMYMADRYGMEICDIPALSMLSPGIGDYPGIEKCRRIFPHKQRGEGHFAALLKKPETAEQPDRRKAKRTEKKDSALEAAIKLWRGFEKDALNITLEGSFVLFGDNLYLMPANIDINKLRVPRCGLQLGTVKKGRIEPAHALSHAFCADAYKSVISFEPDDSELLKYMHGEVISADKKGWCVIAVRDWGIGWGKASGGTVKNHYPKSLRTLTVSAS